MKTSVLLFSILCSVVLVRAAEEQPKELFPDKNLEKVVRKAVYEKRDNDKPLVEADLINISIIQAGNMGISSLDGLEKCESLASLEAGRNDISDLAPLKGMERL